MVFATLRRYTRERELCVSVPEQVPEAFSTFSFASSIPQCHILKNKNKKRKSPFKLVSYLLSRVDFIITNANQLLAEQIRKVENG